jgi:branched-chain amino acid transport system permease protein
MPLWIEQVGLYQWIGLEIMIGVIFALGYNLLLGHTGLPSFGYVAFLGIGAYAFGLAQFTLAESLWLSLLGAIMVTAALGGVAGLLISHGRGIYYALMTIAIGQIFIFVASKWTTVTGGEDGLFDIQRLPVDLGFARFDITDTAALAWFAFACYAVVVVSAPFGKILKTIKQNEARCTFLGHNVVLCSGPRSPTPAP